MFRRALPLVLALGLARSTRADSAGFFEPKALEANGYELRVTAAYYDASRSDFSRPIFLFAHPLSRLHVHEFLLQADLRLRITPALALQCVLPFMVRTLDGLSAGLQVSAQQRLGPQPFSIAGSGLADPTLGLSYRFWRSPPWAAYAELGGTFPVDDDPGSAVVPTRLPLGTGQHVLFAGAGASLREPVRLSLAYRFGLSPGEHAAFLIRRVGTQSYTSGALTAHLQQRVQAAAEIEPWQRVSLQLAAAGTARRWPELREASGDTRFLRERWSYELSIAAAIRVQLAPGQRLELRGEWPIVPLTDVDPFFPIITPARGVGVTWLVGS